MPLKPKKSASSLVRDLKYWLAVATYENCSSLARMGYPFFALNIKPQVEAGDRCVLYRSGKERGFVGVFEFFGQARDEAVDLGTYPRFSVKLPWRAIVISDVQPVEIQPLIGDLEFIANKLNYSMSLRNSFRSISENDYVLISGLLEAQAAKMMVVSNINTADS